MRYNQSFSLTDENGCWDEEKLQGLLESLRSQIRDVTPQVERSDSFGWKNVGGGRFQDLVMRTMIGVGKRRGDLYYLVALASFNTPANSASGIAVDDQCKLKFLELKAKRNFRFIVFKIDEQAQKVMVDKLGQPGQNYDDFAACMPPNECRYAVYDFDFTTNENCQKSKIIFVAWAPATSRVRSKMVYASSKDRFKRELDGIQVELQATDPSEMSMDIVKERAM